MSDTPTFDCRCGCRKVHIGCSVVPAPRRTHTKFGGLIDYERGGVYLSTGAKTTDVPCPRDGELVNVRCWLCGWDRCPTERDQTIANHGGRTFIPASEAQRDA